LTKQVLPQNRIIIKAEIKKFPRIERKKTAIVKRLLYGLDLAFILSSTP
jgi:hypothetical protein